ncbi:putative beta-amylase [Helianthus annuus]|nr:putative beta-amylase [Helianthus annuus]KAJ0891549.1 putative beta-amylase [Helianthus annuus]
MIFFKITFVVVPSPFISYILQCYDEYLRKCLEKAAEAMGISTWGIPPDGAGSYNDEHVDTDFFYYCGDYNGPYGRFFLNWYSQYLIDNGDKVLTKAKLAFGDTLISVKVSRLFHTGIYWWYETNGHAAELTAGYYNPVNCDGYAPIASLLKKHEAALNLTCVDLSTVEEQKDFPEAKVDDPEGLVCQVV